MTTKVKPMRNSNARTPRLLSLSVLALLAGCSMAPIYERPPAPVAAQWPAFSADNTAATTAAADMAWQDFVGDARLRELVTLALDNNRDLRVALAAIEQARAQYQIRRADQLPTINAAVAGNRQPSSDGESISSAYTAGLAMASWELDFFGRVASLKDAALAQFLATQEARNAVQTSLIASVVSTWLSLQTNNELLALTQRTLATRQDSLRLNRMRFEQGVTSALDLRQAESLTAAAQATLAQQRQALAYSEKSAALQARAYALGESGLGDWLLAQRGALDARLAAETAALEAQQAQARVLLDAHRIWTPPGHGTPDAEH